MKTADTLRLAKKVIQTHGWRQGPANVRRPASDERRCMYDALNSVTINAPDSVVIDCQKTLNAALQEMYPLAFKNLGGVGWNDAGGRKVEEVYAVYDKAIELAESGGHG